MHCLSINADGSIFIYVYVFLLFFGRFWGNFEKICAGFTIVGYFGFFQTYLKWNFSWNVWQIISYFEIKGIRCMQFFTLLVKFSFCCDQVQLHLWRTRISVAGQQKQKSLVEKTGKNITLKWYRTKALQILCMTVAEIRIGRFFLFCSVWCFKRFQLPSTENSKKKCK